MKGKPVRVAWRGTEENVVQITWKQRNTKEFHFLQQRKGENVFEPPYSGQYTFTIRSSKEEETSQTFQIWVINPLFLKLLGCIFAAFVLFFLTKSFV